MLLAKLNSVKNKPSAPVQSKENNQVGTIKAEMSKDDSILGKRPFGMTDARQPSFKKFFPKAHDNTLL